jgi:hypothetical protein
MCDNKTPGKYEKGTSMKSVFEDRSCIGSYGRGKSVDWKHSTRACGGCNRVFHFNELIYIPKPDDYYEIPVHEKEEAKV